MKIYCSLIAACSMIIVLFVSNPSQVLSKDIETAEIISDLTKSISKVELPSDSVPRIIAIDTLGLKKLVNRNNDKNTLVHFWVPLSDFNVSELDKIRDLYKTYGYKRIILICFSIDTKAQKLTDRKYLYSKGITEPSFIIRRVNDNFFTLLDEAKTFKNASAFVKYIDPNFINMKDFMKKNLPLSYVVDSNMKIISKIEGPLDINTINSLMK